MAPAKNSRVAESEEQEEKELLVKQMPWLFKYLDFSDSSNFYWLAAFRLFQAVFLTANMAHPDEYWQVT